VGLVMTAPVVLARLAEDQPVFPGEMPVSGRLEPREQPVPDGFRHDVRFYGASTGQMGNLGLSVRCKPCDWRLYLDGGHDLPDLIELVRQHTGERP
jgi:hypothetical protein